MVKTRLTLLFDGGCPFCEREVAFLRSRDDKKRILFVDIDSLNYKKQLYADISYREAMGQIHGINSNGEILKGIEVFREAYSLVGLGWMYAPTKIAFVEPCANLIYQAWAHFRFALTLRPSLDKLCKQKELAEKNH